MIKERPILFSTEMVKAILDGRKTMTRRVCKNQSAAKYEWADNIGVFPGKDKYTGWIRIHERAPFYFAVKCPYGQVGDRLWARETFAPSQMMSGKTEITYKADGGNPPAYLMASGKEIPCYWKPSIFMPRWASRITLEITNIRVERLQNITPSWVWVIEFKRVELE